MSLLIVNKCLTLMGTAPVTDVSESEWGAVLEALEQTFLLNILEKYRWNFAIRNTALLESTTNTNPRYEHSFVLPSDFVRMVEAYQSNSTFPTYEYIVQGGIFYSDEVDPNIAYISDRIRIEDTTQSFQLALAYLIILNSNARLLQNPTLVEYYTNMHEKYYAEAVNLDNTDSGMLPRLNYNQRYL